MRIYIAGRYTAMARLRTEAELIESMGHEVICDCVWLTGCNDDTAPIECASNVLRDLRQSDMLLCYTTEAGTRGGLYVELGVALERGIPVIIVGPYTNVFTRLCRRIDSVKEIFGERTLRESPKLDD